MNAQELAMPHHNHNLTPEQDQQVARFLAQAYADSRPDAEPDTALRENLGYQMDRTADLVRDARSTDDLNLSCWLCYSRLDIREHTHWAHIHHRGRQMCDACANRLENALHSGVITSLIPEEQAALLPAAEPFPDQQTSRRLRRQYANALGWLEQISAGAKDS